MMHQIVLLCAVFVSVLSSVCSSDVPFRAAARQHRFNIVDFGANGDGTTDCTTAFEKAVQAVRDAGEGEVYVPAGRFLTAPFNFTSHMTLFLEANSVILGSTVRSQWPVIPPLPSYGQGRDHPGPRFTSLLHGEHLVDVAIKGNNGTVDGQGAAWWNIEKTYTRGRLVEFMFTDGIEMSNVTFVNSPFWTLHPYASSNIWAHEITILNPLDSHVAPNTDGFDPDSCSHVLLENSYFETGDDGVAIKSGWDSPGYTFNESTSDVTIRNLVVTAPCCAGICIGSEMSGGVTRIDVSNVFVVDASQGLRIKAARGRGGYVTDVHFVDVTIAKSKMAIQVNDDYGGTNPSGHYDPHAVPRVHDIFFANITAHSVTDTCCNLVGLPDSPLEFINFADVSLTPDTGAKGFDCLYVGSGSASRVTPTPCPPL